jgi:muramoyltetrapeptide carboxypeptidase
VAPAGPVSDEQIRTAEDRCRYLGMEPVPGKSLRERTGYLAGTDEQRAADFQAALDGDADAVWAVRGGYGTLRTLDRVDLSRVADRPRAFIGFSDNTAIHLALLQRGVVSFHGPHAGHPHFHPETEASFRAALMSPDPPGPLPLPSAFEPIALVPGTAEGPLVGGNLAMLAAVCGTPYQPDTTGAILFIEDVGESLYRIDRMLVQLRLARLLDDVAGVAVGEFTEMADPVRAAEGSSEPSLERLLVDLLGSLGVPMVMGLPIGHGEHNWTLPMGVRARLDADSGSLEITEVATAGGERQ